MSGFNLTGLWCLEESFAMRMWGLTWPRLQAGKELIPASLLSPHPSIRFQSATLANGSPILAGTPSYYQYIVNAYTDNGVCIIPIIGTLTRYGLCSWGYEDLAGLLAAADKAADIKAVVIRMDSPGGAVDGLRPGADAIRAMKKPLVVWTNFCASAAYFLASQAREIWVEDTVLPAVGSIGTMMVYEDRSGALEKAGLKVEIFRADASVDKARENGIEPLSDKSRASIQATLNAAQKQFEGYVRRGRAGRLKSDAWTTADMYGTDGTIEIGLADRKGTLQQAIQRALQLAA